MQNPHFNISLFAYLAAIASTLLAGAVIPAYAGKSAQAYAHLYVDVMPNIDIHSIPQQPEGILDISGAGRFSVAANFSIVANSDRLQLGCAASDLFAAAVPGGSNSIKLNTTMGCEILPMYAGTLGGHTNRATYATGDPVDVSGFTAYSTNLIPFESSQSGAFSMLVSLRTHYVLPRENMPQGQYGGVVKLIALTWE